MRQRWLSSSRGAIDDLRVSLQRLSETIIQRLWYLVMDEPARG